MRDHLVLLKPPLVPQLWGTQESFVPPKIGGLGGQNHTHNQQRLLREAENIAVGIQTIFGKNETALPPGG
ncbi:hypothetical protein BJP34_32745 [Moorena producens PAL-8-15-08-1]|uniref:Uncharacterized protein n=1 Tax=Moorena producens PAL-8-15-08-1 TaxID=1458985 RepID=A0A1D8U0Y0_9CYAN|nr:hypothetical protein BJP34_32745 [Moorena producens PAL-8-15-08-1]